MKNLFKRLISFMMIGLVMTGTAVSFADAESDSMDEVIQYESVNFNVPGMNVLVVQDGRVIYQSSTGVASVENQTPVTKDQTLIQTGSIGKIITSLALFRLMEDQGIALDEPISGYLIDAYVPDNTLTFRDLLQHTTGIPSIRQNTADEVDPLTIDTHHFSDYASDFITSYKHESVVEIGQDTMYSNIGSVLSGLLIESLSNTPYENYVAEDLLMPLGMDASADVLMERVSDTMTLASGYYIFGGDQTLQPNYDAKLIASDDFLTTNDDMAVLLKYMTSNIDGLEGFFTRQVSAYDDVLGRSLGLTINQNQGVELYLQDGGIPGETSRMFFIPSEKLGVFIWYNSDETALRDVLTDSIVEIYAPDVWHKADPQTIEFNAGEFQDLMGAYTPVNISTETIERVTKIIRQIRVSEVSDGLVIDKETYYPIGNMTFYNAEEERYAKFIFDDSNRLSYLVIDNTYYTYAGIFESLFFQIPILAIVSLINLIALITLMTKWSSLMVNRIHSTPRTVVLVENILSMLSIILVIIIAMRYNAWQVAYNASSSILWLKISGILTGLMYIPSIIMLRRGADDFRWRGFTTFILRMLLISNAILLIWLWQYNFI